MKRFFVLVLVCSTCILHAMDTPERNMATRIEQEIALADASCRLTDVSGKLSDKEYDEVRIDYHEFLGCEMGRPFLVIHGVPGLTVQRYTCEVKSQDGIKNYNDKYRKAVYDAWNQGPTPSRKQLLKKVAHILAMHDITEESRRRFGDSSCLRITLVSAIDSDGFEQCSRIESLSVFDGQIPMPLLWPTSQGQQPQKASVGTTNSDSISDDKKCSKKSATDCVFAALVAGCTAIGGYLCYRAFPAMRRCVKQLYYDLIRKKTCASRPVKLQTSSE